MNELRYKARGGARLNPASALARSAFGYWPMNEGGGASLVNATGRTNGSLTATTWGQSLVGQAPNFNGSTSAASIAIDLSDTAILSLSFWLNWTTFANNDNLLAEYGTSWDLASSFLLDPNASSGVFTMGMGKAAGPAFWQDSFPRPSAGVWHHYALLFNRTTPANTAYVDGVLQTLTATNHGGSAMGNFGNLTLNLMCRNGTTLFGAGSLANLAIFKRKLTPGEVFTLYTDPFGMLEPQRGRVGNLLASSFNPAWAQGSNQFIGGGHVC